MSYNFTKNSAMRSREKRIAMAEAIKALELSDLKKFAELRRRAMDESYDVQVVAKQLQRVKDGARRFEEEARRAKFERLNKPVVVGLPYIDMFGVRGLVAYKTWNFDGRLLSTAMGYHWKELNFADNVPAEDNISGFYCVKMSSLGVMTTGSSYFSNYGVGNVSGFVELLGKVIEHNDGVLRAEVAKLICLFVTTDNSDVVGTVRHLYANYVTPVYVLNPEQLADVVIREVVRQKYLGVE